MSLDHLIILSCPCPGRVLALQLLFSSMSDPFAPPPPYEVTQQYFDNKLDAALQESMAVLSNEEEMWEEWDEAAFEAAALEAARLSGDIGSSSSTLTPPLTSTQSHPQPHERVLPSAQPLRIKKKARPSVSSKDRPSWFEDAGLGQSSSSSTSQWQEDVRPSPSMHVSNASGFTSRQSTPQLPADDEEDRSIPPPPFTAVGPSLDGPPFTEVDPATYPRNAHESPPPSPLVSPTDIHTPLLTMASRLPLPEARHSPPRQSLPTPPRTHVRLGPRPSSSAGHAKPRPHMTAPYVSFDPSVVYTKPGPVTGVQPRVNEVPSLYKSVFTLTYGLRSSSCP
jgi:hypothetical protein